MAEKRGKRHDPYAWVQIPPSPLAIDNNPARQSRRAGLRTPTTKAHRPPMPDLGDFTMTTQEAARLLKLHVVSLRLLIRQGKIKAKKIGTLYLVSRQSVERYKDATAGMAKTDPRRGD